MKKLMFVIAVVSATMVQAASWNWSSSGTVASAPNGGSALAGANIYLFFGYASSSAANTAKGDVLAALRGGSAISGYTQSATLNSSGALETQDFTGDAGKLYGFAVILADDADGNSYMLMTANKNATGADVGTAALGFDISPSTIKAADVTTTGTGAGWYMTKAASGVPEPTSGLLLVLGGAMLALRRRRS